MRRLLLPLLLLTLVGCPSEPVGPGGGDDDDYQPPEYDQGPPISVRADLKAKRWRQIAADLAGAMELPMGELCREFGLYDCSTLHPIPLGGISLENGLFRGLDEPAVTTGLAVERFALHACWERLHRDLDPEATPVVFGTIVGSAGEVILPADADQLVVEIYRRLLARDPSPEETAAVLGLQPDIVQDGGANVDWALMSCFAVATTTEGLLY